MAQTDWFCEQVLTGDMEVKKIWEDDRVLSFHHPRPRAEVHAVIIPKEHVSSILDPKALDGQILTSMVKAVQTTSEVLSLEGKGFHVRVNAASPEVTPHMHWHLIGWE
jgi:histidine triad (HIT) family protein